MTPNLSALRDRLLALARDEEAEEDRLRKMGLTVGAMYHGGLACGYRMAARMVGEEEDAPAPDATADEEQVDLAAGLDERELARIFQRRPAT